MKVLLRGSFIKKGHILTYLCVFIFSFSLFRIASFKEDQQLRNATESLLRNEYAISNPYLISKSLMDLKALRVFRCFNLIDDSNSTYMSDLHHPQCKLTFLNRSVILKALNGRSYKFIFQKPIYPSLLIEVLLTFLAIVLTFSYLKFREAREEIADIKLNIARKISHDIRSPLRTIKQIIENDQINDRETIAMKALERLENIANDLLKQTKEATYDNSYEDLSFANKIYQFIEECNIQSPQVDIEVNGEPFAILPALQRELVRGIANTIQNSIEASSKKITITFTHSQNNWFIKLQDDGGGVSDEILRVLGTRELSTKESGNGIGIFSFSSWLQKKGSHLTLENESSGLRTMIKLSPTFIVHGIVLLDNDPLVQFNWKVHAKKKSVSLSTYSDFNELNRSLGQIDKSAVIFIDYELEESKNGLHYIQGLKKKGFKNLYLCTSHRDIQTEVPKVDKGFPF